MDRNQLLNDQETAIRYSQDELQSRLWTAMPAIVQKVNFSAMTVEVQPAIKGIVSKSNGTTEYVKLPLLVDCPLLFPSAGGFSLTTPIRVGDEVLVLIASRCIDAWWQNGGIQIPMETRMHDLSDGFALPGPRSKPHTLPNISSSNAQLRNDAGTVFFEVGASGKFRMVNPAKNLTGVLDGMIDLLNTLNTALTAFTATTASSPDPSLVSASAALATALGTLTAQLAAYKIADIGGLLG